MGISIIICCYNSSTRLVETLKYIAAQQVSPDLPWEVILVDNASTDNTASAATEFWAACNSSIPMKVISEQRAGLSFARETGVKNASYDIIIFCDDDNWLAHDYVQIANGIMQSDASIAICGGASEAAFGAEKPVWFDDYQLVFGCGPQYNYTGELGLDALAVYGAGMIVRKELYLRLFELKYEFLLTGRKGNKIIAGEDYELCIIARALGYKLYYDDRLKFRHFMPEGRMKWKRLVKTVHGSALSSAIIYIYADSLRYLLTANPRYKVSWVKDLLKAVYGSFLFKITGIRSFQLIWARLTGSVYSVMSNLSNYRVYSQKLKRLYELGHKGAE